MKKLLILFFSLTLSIPVWAGNVVILRVSCTIPQLIQVSSEENKSSNEEKKEEATSRETAFARNSSIIQYEEKLVEGKKVIIKTVVAK